MADHVKLVKLSVSQGATQKNVTGSKNWAAVKKPSGYAIVEATTAPKNSADEWKSIQWSGDAGEAVPGSPNRRKIPLSSSKKLHVEAKLGDTKDFVDIWVVWATVEIQMRGKRPVNSAPFDAGMRDNSSNLGAVSYETPFASVIDEEAGVFANNMGASGKVAPVATLTPKGVDRVVVDGWKFEREVWTAEWRDGHVGPGTNTAWTKDTSNPKYLRLKPDGDSRIYDTDAPDLRWGESTSESYNNFRQWIEWNGEKCSDLAPWFWQARWQANKKLDQQITLNQVGPGNIKLPSKPHFPPEKK